MTSAYPTDPALYIYTSLTAGSPHIVTATSRLETILRANRVPFKALDIATDDKARILWGRRAGKDESGRLRKLPGLVQEGMILGDIVEIEEWNEYGELKEHVKIYYDDFTIPSISQKPKTPPPKKSTIMKPTVISQASTAAKEPPPAPPMPESKPASSTRPDSTAKHVALPVRSAAGNVAEEAAKKAKEMRLQALREKVHGKGGKKPEEGKGEETEEEESEDDAEEEETDSDEFDTASEDVSEEDDDDDDDDDSNEYEEDEDEKPSASKGSASSSSLSTPHTKHALSGTKASAGATTSVQSPTLGAWKNRRKSSGASSASDEIRAMLQSPTSTSWKPTDFDKPVTSFHGAKMMPSATEKEISAVEKAETIVEEPEPEDEEDKKEREKRKAEKKKSSSSKKSKEKSGDKKDKKEKKSTKEKKDKKDKKSHDKPKKKADSAKDKTKKKTTHEHRHGEKAKA
ncbi:hypothetical protein MKZ38_003316 [Zalerion maritima]|uniref:Cylicin I n=1 Tax=Zalerion maritima TaxID=339359 RepID=A0AAD5WQR5_9PEZI|nr:hypothetical protein MKZ38_003316 [Zalerion maritima]